jgi:hypothetical protein
VQFDGRSTGVVSKVARRHHRPGWTLGPSSFYLVLKLSLACKIRDSAFWDIGAERLRISKMF